MDGRRSRQFNPTTHVVLGILLAVIGVLFTLDNLHLLHARAILRYWPATCYSGFVVTCAKDSAHWRLSQMNSSPAIDPLPKVPSRIARRNASGLAASRNRRSTSTAEASNPAG